MMDVLGHHVLHTLVHDQSKLCDFLPRPFNDMIIIRFARKQHLCDHDRLLHLSWPVVCLFTYILTVLFAASIAFLNVSSHRSG